MNDRFPYHSRTAGNLHCLPSCSFLSLAGAPQQIVVWTGPLRMHGVISAGLSSSNKDKMAGLRAETRFERRMLGSAERGRLAAVNQRPKKRTNNNILGSNDDGLDCPLKGLPVATVPGSSSSYGGGGDFVSPPIPAPRQPMITCMAADIFIKQHRAVFACAYPRTITVNL